MRTQLFASYNNGILTLQPKSYIEDGWYIEHSENYWKLFEIPQFGGNPKLIGNYDSIGTALKYASKLT